MCAARLTGNRHQDSLAPVDSQRGWYGIGAPAQIPRSQRCDLIGELCLLRRTLRQRVPCFDEPRNGSSKPRQVRVEGCLQQTIEREVLAALQNANRVQTARGLDSLLDVG